MGFLVLCHPDTVRVVQSSNAPKAPTYNFVKPFIGMYVFLWVKIIQVDTMCLICLLSSLKIASRRRLVNLVCVQNPSPQKKKKTGTESFFLRGEESVCTQASVNIAQVVGHDR